MKTNCYKPEKLKKKMKLDKQIVSLNMTNFLKLIEKTISMKYNQG